MASTSGAFGLRDATRELARLARGRGNLWWQVGDPSQWVPRRQETSERLRGADRLVASLAAVSARISGSWWREGHGEVEVVLSDGTIIVPVTVPRHEASTVTPNRLARVTDALMLGAGMRVLVGGTRRPTFSEDRNALLVPSNDAWRDTEAGVAQLVDAIAHMRLSAYSSVETSPVPLVTSLACAFTLSDVSIAPSATDGGGRGHGRQSQTTQPTWLDNLTDASVLVRCAEEAECLSDELAALVAPESPHESPVPQEPVHIRPKGNGCEAPARPEKPSGPYTLRQAMRTASAASEALADSGASAPT